MRIDAVVALHVIFLVTFYISSFSGSRNACLLVTYYPYMADNVQSYLTMVNCGMLGTSLTMDLAATLPTPDPPLLLWDSTHLLVLLIYSNNQLFFELGTP